MLTGLKSKTLNIKRNNNNKKKTVFFVRDRRENLVFFVPDHCMLSCHAAAKKGLKVRHAVTRLETLLCTEFQSAEILLAIKENKS